VTKKHLFTACILCLLVAALVSGCTSANERKLEQATVLMESASEKLTEIEDLDWDKKNHATIKAQFAGMEVDIDEVLKILYTIEPADEEERRMIDAYVVLCVAERELCNIIRTDMADGMGHLFRAEDYTADDNIGGARAELRLAQSDLQDAQTRLLKIEQDIDGISLSDIPVEERGELASAKVVMDEFVDELAEVIDMLDSAT